ncbi:Os07g0591400, partial [Oryza sativa Japonica Group]
AAKQALHPHDPISRTTPYLQLVGDTAHIGHKAMANTTMASGINEVKKKKKLLPVRFLFMTSPPACVPGFVHLSGEVARLSHRPVRFHDRRIHRAQDIGGAPRRVALRRPGRHLHVLRGAHARDAGHARVRP